MGFTAIILAGGLGTRLRSIVNDRPKPMAPILGKPFLAYQIEYWINQGINNFVLSVGYKHEMIIEYFGYEYNGAKINYAIENTPLGTGGGLLLAIDKIKAHESFLLLNGDTYFMVDLPKLIRFADINNADFTFSLFKTYDKERYMGIELDKNGRVICLKSHSQQTDYNLASGGVYWVKNPEIFSEFRTLKLSPISFEEKILPTIFKAQRNIFGKLFDKDFIDIGVPEDYLRSSMILKQKLPSNTEA